MLLPDCMYVTAVSENMPRRDRDHQSFHRHRQLEQVWADMRAATPEAYAPPATTTSTFDRRVLREIAKGSRRRAVHRTTRDDDQPPPSLPGDDGNRRRRVYVACGCGCGGLLVILLVLFLLLQ